MKNNLFFWVLCKKIKFLFDIKKNNYAIVNLMYAGLIFFYSLVIGKLCDSIVLDSFASIASIILWGLYMIMILSKKDFKNRIINKFYPISKIKQYLLHFFLSFFDYYLILFSFSGIGLYVSNENFLLTDLLFFPVGLLYVHALISILSAFPHYTFFSKVIKFITLSLNVFLVCTIANYPQYWITYIFFSSLISCLIGYLLFLYTYSKSPTQKEVTKCLFIFRKQKEDRIIAKKRDLKQAAMQQLLTGQSRLPGFSGEWEIAEFGDIATIRNVKVISSSTPAGTPCVELESIEQGNGRLLAPVEYPGSSSKYRFEKEDVLFGRLRAYLRKYWLAQFDGVCSTEIWPLIPRDERLYAGYLHLLVQTNAFVDAAGVSYGTHMPRSDWSVLGKFSVQLPPLPEQTVIATLLSDMDAELSALVAQRDKTRDLKQAMMQELLTGRIRLV